MSSPLSRVRGDGQNQLGVGCGASTALAKPSTVGFGRALDLQYSNWLAHSLNGRPQVEVNVP